MKKKYIVSASLLTLLGLGVITSHEVYGAEVTGTECSTADVFTTKLRMKSKVDLSVDEQKQFGEFINQFSSSDPSQEVTNIGTVSVKDTFFKHFVEKDAQGTVGTNLGVDLCNPNRFGEDFLGEWIFNEQLVDVDMHSYNIYKDQDDNNIVLFSYQGSVSQPSAFTVRPIGANKKEAPKITGITEDRYNKYLNMDFSKILSDTEGKAFTQKYQVELYGFPVAEFTMKREGNSTYVSYKITTEREIRVPNAERHVAYMTSDFKADYTYKAGDTVELHYWVQVGDNKPEQIKTTKVTFTKSQSNQPEKPGDNDNQPEKPGDNDNQPEKPGDNDNQPEKPEKPGDNDNKPEKPEKPGDNDNKPEKPEKPGDNDNKPEKPGKPGDNESEKPQPKDSVIVYRLYNPNNGDHLFTQSDKEYKELEAVGWEGEGVAWFTPKKTNIPVYRLYNPNTGEHFYTDSEKEYKKVGKAGWDQEGIAFYSLTMTDEDSQAIYRTFNPNTDGPGSHMFTVSAKEYNQMVRAGWRGERIAFYGVE